jgi:hypothetical protein
LLHSK